MRGGSAREGKMATADAEPSDTDNMAADDSRAVAAVEATAKAKKLRDRAEECRILARIMTSRANMAYYLNLAMTYDRLAEQQEQLARDIVKFNIKTSMSGLGS